MREALVERLGRLMTGQLRDKLTDESGEIRRAACTAIGKKKDEGMASDLIARIEDKDLEVVRAARAALHAISGEDFGPFGEADADDRADAAKRRAHLVDRRPARGGK